MSLKANIMQLQKARINGPFQQVTYIDPYPDEMLKAPSSKLSRYIILLGLLSFVFSIIFGFMGEMDPSQNIANPILAQIFHALLLILNGISTLFKVEQLPAAIIAVGFCMAICITSIVTSNIETVRYAFAQWKSIAHCLDADIVESEIQSSVAEKKHGSKGFKTIWMYRLKVAFTYNGRLYEATPSVVNRLDPGTVAKYFDSEGVCRHEVDSYHGKVKIEIDPSNPLDCEIAGQLQRQYRKSYTNLFFLALFFAAIFGMTYLFIFVIENGHTSY